MGQYVRLAPAPDKLHTERLVLKLQFVSPKNPKLHFHQSLSFRSRHGGRTVTVRSKIAPAEETTDDPSRSGKRAPLRFFQSVPSLARAAFGHRQEAAVATFDDSVDPAQLIPALLRVRYRRACVENLGLTWRPWRRIKAAQTGAGHSSRYRYVGRKE